MTKKQLQRYRSLVSEREDIEALILELETEYASLRVSKLDSAPRGWNAGGDFMADILIRRDELLSTYRGKLEGINAELRALENAIDGLEPIDMTLENLNELDDPYSLLSDTTVNEVVSGKISAKGDAGMITKELNPRDDPWLRLRNAIIERVVDDLKKFPPDQWENTLVGWELKNGKYDWLLEGLPCDGAELFEKLKEQKIRRKYQRMATRPREGASVR